MSLAPLSSGTVYAPALGGLASASRDLQNSVTRLATGSRFANAGDDVAALAISTNLKSQVVALKVAQTNSAQASSFTQVAYGGLAQIRDLLDAMYSLATQANSGSLTTADRAMLQTEFSAYKDEIDRIAENTAFGDIKLLDGTVSGESAISSVTDSATSGSLALAFTANPTAGQTVIVNGVSLAANTAFSIGGSTDITVGNLATAINSSTNTALTHLYAEASGSTLTLTSLAGGARSNTNLIVNDTGSTASFTVSGAATPVAGTYRADGGADDGLGLGTAFGYGTIGNNVVTAVAPAYASSVLTISGTVSNGELLRIDDGNGGYRNFTFATTASADTDIQIGGSTAETIQNIISAVSQYEDSADDFVTSQLLFERSGNSLIIHSKTGNAITDVALATADIAETMANGSLSSATLTGAAGGGFSASGTANAALIGTLDDPFTATYTGADAVTLSMTVGDVTYTGSISDTTPGVDTTVRLRATDNESGYFDVTLASGNGSAVSNQTTADDYADRLNTAISTITFYQERQVSSFTGEGDLSQATARMQLSNFNSARITDLTVTAPSVSGGDATIDITVALADGTTEIFRNNDNAGSLGAYETLYFRSLTNSNNYISLQSGSDEAVDFSDTDAALAFQDTLRASFEFGENGAGLDFQLGISSADKINVSIADMRSSRIFGGETPDISTQGGAEAAQDVVDDARSAVSQAIAQVGSYQARFDYAARNLASWEQGVEQARSQLADTDIASESTAFAVSTLRANMAAAVIAQVQQLQSGMLGLLKMAA